MKHLLRWQESDKLTMPPKFFITHSWKDIAFANKLCDDLRAAGLGGFIDSHSIHPGDSIPSRVERGLNECDVYLPVFSPDMLASDWCDWEIDMAITMNRNGKDHPRIIPVIARPCTVPNKLGHLLYVSFIGRYDDALNELLTEGFGMSSNSPASPVALPLPEQKAPAATVIPQPAPKTPAASKLRSKWVVPIIGALVAVMILIMGGIGMYLTGFFAQPTPTLRAIVPTLPIVPTTAPSAAPVFGIGSTKTVADGAPMMFVPAGEFLMGSNDADKQAQANEKPQHTVYLDAFWIDKYEVTNALFKKCVDAGQCPAPADWVNGTIPPDKENNPVVGVSWNNAMDYAQWIGGRLPTEAEWEKTACWDGANQVKRIYPWGNTFDKSLLNSYESGKGGTTPVGSYPGGGSPYGVLDLAGNVSEWTADWYNDSYYSISPKDNPQGPASGQGRVLRGGSWGDDQGSASCAYRNSNSPDLRNPYIGFRVAESVSP